MTADNRPAPIETTRQNGPISRGAIRRLSGHEVERGCTVRLRVGEKSACARASPVIGDVEHQ
jgi:hypothetical protein